MKNRIAAIVVTFNRLKMLQECIQSLREQTCQFMTIIVINNGSTDGTKEWLDEQQDIIKIHQKNSGGAGGFFTGIKYACEHKFEYSWIMDDDVFAIPDALEKLMKSSDSVDGFLCSRVLDLNGEQCNVPKISTDKSKNTGEFSWGKRLGNNLLKVDVTSFVSVLIKNKIVFELGLPYMEYFIWGDDTEYTSRISKIHPSYMAIDSVVIHKRANRGILSLFTETDKKRLKNYFYFYRNRIHCQRTFSKKLVTLIYSFYQSCLLLLRGKFYASYIALKGILASLVFHPTIHYPQNA